MAHFAKIENGVVVEIIVADQEVVDSLDGVWVQTSYNTINGTHVLGGTPMRHNYAKIGGLYDEGADVFYPQKPYQSWLLNKNTWLWYAPKPLPDDSGSYDENGIWSGGVEYSWDEENLEWVSNV